MHFYTGILLPKDKVNVEEIDKQMYPFGYEGGGSNWDWYRIGGRWDGYIKASAKVCPEDQGFNFSPKHELLVNNMLEVEDVLGLATKDDYNLPMHILVDGKWYDLEKEEKAGRRYLLEQYQDRVMVGLDVHN